MSKSIALGLLCAGALLLAALLTGCSDEPSPTPSAPTPTPTMAPTRHASTPWLRHDANACAYAHHGSDTHSHTRADACACAHHGSDKHAHASADACGSDLIP